MSKENKKEIKATTIHLKDGRILKLNQKKYEIQPQKRMSKEGIKDWIARWKSLKPSKARDMMLKIWSKGLNQKKDE